MQVLYRKFAQSRRLCVTASCKCKCSATQIQSCSSKRGVYLPGVCRQLSTCTALFTIPDVSPPRATTRLKSGLNSDNKIPESLKFSTSQDTLFPMKSCPPSGLSLRKMDEEWLKVQDILGKMTAVKKNPNAVGSWRDAFEYMPIHLKRVGLSEDALKKMNFVHVTGTKGKGSTCAMVENVLRNCGYKTGLYTSPHLVDPRERIRIQGELVSKEVFSRAFWQVYGDLERTTTADVGMPGFFNFMTLLGMRIFVDADVDVAVLEVGIGGRFDATSAVARAPHLVCGVASLGLDHMEMLGGSLRLIAREKAGIFKHGCAAFSVDQPPEGMDELAAAAAGIAVDLTVVRPLESFGRNSDGRLKVGIGGTHMRVNASLAVQLAAAWERHCVLGRDWEGAPCTEGLLAFRVPEKQEEVRRRVQAVQCKATLPYEYVRGIADVRWDGRSQIIRNPWASSVDAAREDSAPQAATGGQGLAPVDDAAVLYLDGAHTPESMDTCALWFYEELTELGVRSPERAEGAAVAPAGSGGVESAEKRNVTAEGFGGNQDECPSLENSLKITISTTNKVNVNVTPFPVLLFGCTRDRDPSTLLPPLLRRLKAQGLGPLPLALFAPMTSGYTPPPMTVPITGTATAAPSSTTAAPPPALEGSSGSRASSPVPEWVDRMKEVWIQEVDRLFPDSVPSTLPQTALPSGEGKKASGATLCRQQINLGSARIGTTSSSGSGAAVAEAFACLPDAMIRLRELTGAVRSLNNTNLPGSSPPVQLHVLVTGSLYLVGDALQILERPPA